MGLVLLCPTWESRGQEAEMRKSLSQREGQAKSEKGMKDSERLQEKCQTVSQRSGEGPSAATQESKSQPWLSSQGEHGPLLGSWRKEKQFPRVGSDRNATHTPEEPQRQALNQRERGFFRDLPGP